MSDDDALSTAPRSRAAGVRGLVVVVLALAVLARVAGAATGVRETVVLRGHAQSLQLYAISAGTSCAEGTSGASSSTMSPSKTPTPPATRRRARWKRSSST